VHKRSLPVDPQTVAMRPVWHRAPGPWDKPTGWRIRLLGIGGVAAIMLLALGGTWVTWTTDPVPPEPATLTLLAIAPPAAPPEPVREIPPGPLVQQKAMERVLTRLEPPRIMLPEIPMAGENTPSPPVTPPTRPEASTKDATAPESAPLPPAPQISTGKPTWERLVLGALNKVKRYPRGAMLRRQQGIPWIRFVMNRKGDVLSVQLAQSSGFLALDDEAVALPARAAPLPEPPETVPGLTLELVVPVEFFMR
jgi:protein TonB